MIGIASIAMLGPKQPTAPPPAALGLNREKGNVREAFNDFVGQTFFSQMLSSMRETVGKPAYFHGGRAEEVFQGQLDAILSERLSDASAERFADPMFELFMLQRP